MPTLAPNSLVVVVGITGYIAAHIGIEALKAGFRVRGTVRDTKRADELRAAYVKAGLDISKLEIVKLDDLLSEAQFAEAFAGADVIINPALPDFQGGTEYVDQVVESILLPLRVATKVSTLKKYVLTSTMGAVHTMPPTDSAPAKPLDQDDWNDEAVAAYKAMSKQEIAEQKDWWSQYLAAKTIGEQAAWKFVKDNKVKWDFATVLPACTWGPVVFGEARLTASMITNLFKGVPMLYHARPQWYVDVRDCAKLHVLALTDAELTGKRIFAAAGPIGIQKVMTTLRNAFPSAKLPDDPDADVGAVSKWKVDNTLATKALGGKWISLEETVVDLAKSVGY